MGYYDENGNSILLPHYHLGKMYNDYGDEVNRPNKPYDPGPPGGGGSGCSIFELIFIGVAALIYSLWTNLPVLAPKMLELHNNMRWPLIGFGALVLINAAIGLSRKSAYRSFDKVISFLFMLALDVQASIIGILYYKTPPLDLLSTMHKYYKQDFTDRFFSPQYAIMMGIALIFTHTGRVVARKAYYPAVKYKRILIFFGLAILIIIAAIPFTFITDF